MLLLLTSITCLAAVVSVAAALIAIRHAASCTEAASKQSSTIKSLRALELEVGNLDTALEQLHKSHGKLRSRFSMREYREGKQQQELQLEGDAWKKKTRRELGSLLLSPGAATKIASHGPRQLVKESGED